MARQIIRQERQARRDTHAGGQKKSNPLASGFAKRCVRCAAPWAKRYVPGSKESGAALPEQTTKSGLTCPPHRSCWVALYYNTALQANKKRPTRSKTFHASASGVANRENEGTSEHRAFQIAFEWLWSRHESCCNPTPPRPSWVVEALADCSLGARGEACNFMEQARAVKVPREAVRV